MKKILIVIIAGLVLRVVCLNQSLWLDEAISVLAARDFSYPGIVFDFLKIDNHPPLYYLLLKLWGEIFGFTDWMLRTLSILLGTLLIYITYRITQKVSENKTTALISAVLAAVSPILVYYSQEVRMYILITLLVAAQFYIFVSLLKKEKIWLWILFSLVNCLLFFSDYITVFIFPIFFLYPLFKINFRFFTKVVTGFIPLGILLILWAPMLGTQLAVNKDIINAFPGWKEVIGGSTFKNLAVLFMKFTAGRISFEPKILYYFWVIFSSIPVAAGLFLARRRFKKDILIWVWFIFPLTIGFLFSFFLPVFNYFRFIYAVPALLILVCIGLFRLRNSKLKYFLIGWILLTNLISLSIYYLDLSQQRENWKQAVSFIEQNGRKDDLVIFEFKEEFAPYRFYQSGKIDSVGATDSYFADKEKTEMKLQKSLKGKNGVYHFEYLRDLTDPQKFVEQKLQDEGFTKNKVFNDFYNIGQISYWIR